jgi:hypothetical protein
MTNVTSKHLKWVFVDTVIKLTKFRKNREFLDQMSDSQLPKEGLLSQR